ncbi:hypothetical protein MLD38_023726 [Melastoma candidum]|uniref:Uncharacterized protein n=1 Tax=Melastoma candidum TaxID=119954 RepID=A0ACB9NV14_9MYRT|nr:hypothetical protein MLD38_023726 [Melastoma candidum]
MRLLLLNMLLAALVSRSYAGTSSGFVPGNSLDALAEDSAYKTLVQLHPHTGALNQAFLPANFSGMKVSAVRLRSRTLWRTGTNVSSFSIPARTVTVPHVKRLLIVYHDLGNWSNWYYASRVHGYSLATSIVGFAVYDASNSNSSSTVPVDLDTRGNLIFVRFPSTGTSGIIRSTHGGKCLLLRRDKTTSLSDVIHPNTCQSGDQGKFAIIVPTEVPTETRGVRRHRHWVISAAAGLVGLSLIMSAFLGWLLIRIYKLGKAGAPKRGTEDEEMFASIWVADSKMPFAIVTRTQPVLEN